MTRQGYEAYKLYLALQRHFSTNYDFEKYNGKVNVSKEAYSKRNDMYSFEKLVKIMPDENLTDFYIAHFLDNPKCWIRNMSKMSYEPYKSKMKNFVTLFKEDMYLLKEYNPVELMEVGNDIPTIHQLAISKKINLETLITMDQFFPFIDEHSEKVKVPFVFPDHIKLLQNYRTFFKHRVTDIHKDIMKNVLLG